jgi:hypothetical protein
VTGVTFNGVALTRYGHSAVAGNTMEWWRLTTPSSGAHNLVISLSSARRVSAGVANLTGWPADTTKFRLVTSGRIGSPPSVTVDSTAAAEVITWLGFNDPANNVTEPAGSTPLWNQEGAGGGVGSSGDQVSAASIIAGADFTVTLAWAGSVVEAFGVAALSFIATNSRQNLLSGNSHTVNGSNNFIAGDTNAITGATSEAHGTLGTVTATRSVLFAQDGSPHTLSADGTVSIYASDILFNGTSVKNAISALTGDVTATGPGSVAATIASNAVTTTKINNSAVTLAKIANAAANSKLLGSGAAGSGSAYTELTLGTGLSMSGTTLNGSSGTGTVTHTGALTSGQLVLGNGTDDVAVGNLTGDVTTSGSGATTAKTALKTRAITFVIDGGGSVIAAGTYAPAYIPYACTITAVTMLANVAGAIVVDLQKNAYASYPTATSITASAKPTISATNDHSQDNTLTGWTTSVSAGDFIVPVLASPSTTITRISVTLTVTV